MNKGEIFLTKKKINNIKIALISDIHYGNKFKLNIFNKILKQVKIINPNYVFIAGDLIDCKNINYNIIEDFLRKLSKSRKVFIGFGNHEFYDFFTNKKKIATDNLEIREVISKLKNCYLLDDDTYIEKDNNLSITGITLSGHYYRKNENINILIRELKKKKLKLDNNKYNILLLHSPYNIYKDKVRKYLSKFDLVLSGHMHGGLVHPLINIFFKKNSGIISPNKKWFPKLVRGRIDVLEFDSYIYEGITKLSETSGKYLSYLDFLYPKKVKEIIIKKEN